MAPPDPEYLLDLGLLLLDSLLSERERLLDLDRDLEVEEFIIRNLLAGNREEIKITTVFQNLIARTNCLKPLTFNTHAIITNHIVDFYSMKII